MNPTNKSPNWTAAEHDYLRAHYATESREAIEAALPGRKWHAIRLQGALLKVDRLNRWLPAEDEALRGLYHAAEQTQVQAALPGRPWGSIQDRARKLHLTRRNFWTATDAATLRQHYSANGPAYVGQLLGRTPVAVQKQAEKMGVRRVFTGRPANRIVKTPKPVKVKAPKPPKAVVVKAAKAKAPKVVAPKAVPLLAVKRSAGTPNLNVAKEARKRREEGPKRTAVVTADEVRRLPYHHAGRMAYMLHGQAGWQQWQQQQAAARP